MKYFLFDNELAQEIDLNDSGEVTVDEATSLFYHLSEQNGSFFGLQNEHGTILQFAWERSNRWLVDMPLDGGKTYQLTCDYDTCTAIIGSFFNGHNVPHIYKMALADM